MIWQAATGKTIHGVELRLIKLPFSQRYKSFGWFFFTCY